MAPLFINILLFHLWGQNKTDRSCESYCATLARLYTFFGGCDTSSFLAATHDCVAPYVDIILQRGRFWAKSAASGSVRWCCFRSCWTVLSHVMQGRPSCLLQSAGWEAKASGCDSITLNVNLSYLYQLSAFLLHFLWSLHLKTSTS